MSKLIGPTQVSYVLAGSLLTTLLLRKSFYTCLNLLLAYVSKAYIALIGALLLMYFGKSGFVDAYFVL